MTGSDRLHLAIGTCYMLRHFNLIISIIIIIRIIIIIIIIIISVIMYK